MSSHINQLNLKQAGLLILAGLSLSFSLAKLVYCSLTHNKVKLVFSGAALVLVG